MSKIPDGAAPGFEIAPNGIASKWRLKMTGPGGNVHEEVEDMLLILGYQ
jgi:hypothetical protein